MIRSFHSLRVLLGVVAVCIHSHLLDAQELDVAASGKSVLERTEDPQTGLRVMQTEKGWEVWKNQQLVAGYVQDANGTPAIYPLIGPAGKRMTRDYPFTAAGVHEKDDHDHHRSLWFTHGEVNGIDFWTDDDESGRIVQVSGDAKIEEGVALIETENDWKSADGELILSDVRRWAFFEDAGRRVVDFDVSLRATNGVVHFGDTKEGTFGLRVAGSMKVTANQGGIIINADERTNLDAWGKSSRWVDYSGPIDGKTMGITIHDHPSSFGYPARFHVRTYGLFAANPFGYHHFEGVGKRGGIVLPHGRTMQLHYRLILHVGGLDGELTNKDSESYANDPRPSLESSRPIPAPPGEANEEDPTEPSKESRDEP